MGKMVNGEWHTDWYEPDEDGRFVRPDTTFHNRISAAADAPFPAIAGRYHLYVSYACPWAHRSLIIRQLKGLEEVISVSAVHPYMGADGWSFSTDFPAATGDALYQEPLLQNLYRRADAQYTGRVTVPVLWDKQTEQIVNNESRDILRMLDTEFDHLAKNPHCYVPEAQQAAIDAMIDANYEPINNGVYRAGFATSQQAYDEAVAQLFERLDELDSLLSTQRYLCGEALTEADICLFTTLLRFDAVYFIHFKCSQRLIADYAHLAGYLRDIYQTGSIRTSCKLDHIKAHYYGSHPNINPSGIVPAGPVQDFERPQHRGN